MNEKQQQLTFEKGITTIPSDSLCSDNALENETNLIYRDGEHHVIQSPEYEFGINGTLLFVHKLPGGGEKYIYEGANADTNNAYHLFIYGSPNSIGGSAHTNNLTPKDVTAIGKTLIVNMSGDIKYFLWNGTGYKSLGKIKEPDTMQFIVANDGEIGEAAPYSSDQYNTYNYGRAAYVVNQKEYDNLVLGLYSKLVKKAAENKRFVKPFVIRYAVELYDGSYTCISNPIICYAGVRCNARAVRNASDGNAVSTSMFLRTFQLRFLAKYDYTDYQDIVKDVVVFMSEGVNLYNLATSQTMIAKWNDNESGIYADEVSGNVYSSYDWNYYPIRNDANFQPLTPAGEKAIEDGLKGASNFYKIAELGMKQDTDEYKDIDEYIDTNILTNLTSQERLTQDYFTHSVISSDEMLTYNNRLLLTNAKRSFFSGFKFFSAWGAGNISAYKIYVYIKTDSGDRVVCSGEWRTMRNIGHYIYYPDPRAYKAVIFKNGSYYGTVKLKEHPGLNGAYYYSGLPRDYSTGTSFAPPTEETTPTEPTVSNEPETLVGRIYVSEVNNPFTFTSRGDITVGNGKILGAAALTQALSQGQFGQYPLIAFCTDGIWALSVNSEGVFTSVHPMSREVALESNPCITQTDGAIFFVSKKGLMVVVGNDVRCVSEQLSGKSVINFDAYFSNCMIAYDYRDSLLWIFNADYNSQYALVYSIKTGTFAWKKLDSEEANNVINNYPDYLIQDNVGSVYSLYHRVAPVNDTIPYNASIKTRPMKLENALALKSIMQIRHIYDFYKYATIGLKIEASNNMREWETLRSLGGTPWKYYRFTYNFDGLQAADTFSGSILITQERRTNKLR